MRSSKIGAQGAPYRLRRLAMIDYPSAVKAEPSTTITAPA